MHAAAGRQALTDKDNGTTHEVTKGDGFDIVLQSHGDGGFQFQAPVFDTSILKLVSTGTARNPGAAEGDFGDIGWHFEAIASGTATVSIREARPFAPTEDPIDFSLTVVVK